MYNHAYNYITIDYQQIVYGNIANQIHGFTIDCGKIYTNIIRIGHGARALIGQKPMVYQRINYRKSVVYCFSQHYL